MKFLLKTTTKKLQLITSRWHEGKYISSSQYGLNDFWIKLFSNCSSTSAVQSPFPSSPLSSCSWRVSTPSCPSTSCSGASRTRSSQLCQSARPLRQTGLTLFITGRERPRPMIRTARGSQSHILWRVAALPSSIESTSIQREVRVLDAGPRSSRCPDPRRPAARLGCTPMSTHRRTGSTGTTTHTCQTGGTGSCWRRADIDYQ